MYSTLKQGNQHSFLSVTSDILDLKLFAYLSGILVILWLATPVYPVVFILLALHALRGPKETVQSIMILSLLLILNRGLVPMDVKTVRWLVIFAAFVRTAWDGIILRAPTPTFFLPLVLFFMVVLVLSLFVSPILSVSALKIITFFMGITALSVSMYRTSHMMDYWQKWVITIGLFIIFASQPLYLSPYGYMINGRGFQGITFHPQTYGPVLAPVVAYLTGSLIIKWEKSFIKLAGALLGWAGIFASQSRTAFLAVFGGLTIALIVQLFQRKRQRVTPRRAPSLVSATLVALGLSVVFLLQWQQLGDTLQSFLLKDGDTENISESLGEGRSLLINRSLNNFVEAPLTGIGFGVPSNMLLFQGESEGIVSSASTEKGFMPSAVLEEMGIVGTLMVIWLLITLIKPAMGHSSFNFNWMLFTCIMVNLGEMVFFSVGGMGLFLWVCMCFCHYHVEDQV